MYPFQGFSVAGRAGDALQRDAYVVYLHRSYGPQVTGRAVQSERDINDGGILVYICSVTIAQITCPAVVQR
jgi:hypothetical protein